LDAFYPWIVRRMTELLGGVEDDIVINMVFHFLSQSDSELINPKTLQFQLLGFLESEKAAIFVTELWTLLLAAQNSSSGIPPAFIEEKKSQLIQKLKQNS
jgi:serine/arginine repetitive matrix protein 1